MKTEKTIYSDDQNVMVTTEKFKVKNHTYQLENISKHELLSMKPKKLPFILLLIIGVTFVIIGFVMDFDSVLEMGAGYVSINTILLWTGLAISVAVIGAVMVNKVKYAVRVETAQGQENAIVSTRKSYISCINDAINEALEARRRNKKGAMST